MALVKQSFVRELRCRTPYTPKQSPSDDAKSIFSIQAKLAVLASF